jgi:hypothetical protein
MEVEEEIKRQSSGSEDEEEDLPPMLETATELEGIPEANTTAASIPTNLMSYDSSSDEEKSKSKVSNICDDLEELD